ncbi:MAG: hypothetical protein ISR85_05830 [Kiritimatiellales bacterium]|nr:hypothetical protein [Kiritimatiellota bacterium]MBL7012430.1 hypothetical protein [Kiritimatiellales bacterium]
MKINFWNGNKSNARQVYELQILEAALAATEQEFGAWTLESDCTDFPTIEGEASVFRSKGFDLFATVAGNPKLANERKIVINTPLMKGLLGYRLLIVRENDLPRFAQVDTASQMQKLALGIPFSWADADLFRFNGYTVVEGGTYDELFDRLKSGEFDYVTLGANEIEEAFEARAFPVGGLNLEASLLIYYPFPLLFYVNPDQPELAKRIEEGLDRIIENGALDRLFEEQYGDLVARLRLKERKTFRLENPNLSDELAVVMRAC